MEKPRVSYFWDESVGVYASVEANLIKPHIVKCAHPPYTLSATRAQTRRSPHSRR